MVYKHVAPGFNPLETLTFAPWQLNPSRNISLLSTEINATVIFRKIGSIDRPTGDYDPENSPSVSALKPLHLEAF